MKQPDLGKKIAELRKAKSLTQEELVEKCNLNVRTLQRIEAGVVTPRSYTIKAIFAALEYNMNDSLEIMPNKVSKTGLASLKWLEQFYRYVFDLFNLKTNKMKKLSILSSCFLIICICLFGLSSESIAQKKNESKSDIGKSKFIKSNGRGIIYLFPKNLSWYVSNRKDTADYKMGNFLVQEYKYNIFLNKEFVGIVHLGDTVILDQGKIEIRRPYCWEFKSPNGKGIVYVIPKNLKMESYSANKDTDNMIVENSHIVEFNNKIFLDRKYCGIANTGDSVIFIKRSLLSKSSLSIRKGFYELK
jgi:transcriptional regulator with XRE-family HTH domain